MRHLGVAAVIVARLTPAWPFTIVNDHGAGVSGLAARLPRGHRRRHRAGHRSNAAPGASAGRGGQVVVASLVVGAVLLVGSIVVVVRGGGIPRRGRGLNSFGSAGLQSGLQPRRGRAAEPIPVARVDGVDRAVGRRVALDGAALGERAEVDGVVTDLVEQPRTSALASGSSPAMASALRSSAPLAVSAARWANRMLLKPSTTLASGANACSSSDALLDSSSSSGTTPSRCG